MTTTGLTNAIRVHCPRGGLLQANAEHAVREMLVAFSREQGLPEASQAQRWPSAFRCTRPQPARVLLS